MQVFVPYDDFNRCAQSLDKSRLNKQIIECCQLLDILFNIPTKTGKPRTGWLKHPALLAWKDCPGGLYYYTICCIAEAKKRNVKVDSYVNKLKDYGKPFSFDSKPIWWGDDLIHSSHRARLLQKGWESMLKADTNQTKVMSALKVIEWYSAFNWVEMQDEELMCKEYQWPFNITHNHYELQVIASKDALKNKEKLIETFGKNPFKNS